MNGGADLAGEQAAGWSVWSPRADPDILTEVVTRIEAGGVSVERARPLGPLTTFGIGGRAAAFVLPTDLRALTVVQGALAATASDDVPVLVLGKGSNLLVGDCGFPGLVVKLGAGFKQLSREGDVVTAGAGEAMPALAAWVAKEGLAGLEFAAGIPATVGGSVRMNAGAHGVDVSASLVDVEVLLAGAAEPTVFSPGDLGFGYRRTRLPERSVVVGARWRLVPDEPRAIRARLDELRAWRRSTQPLRSRNCGSVFTNPAGDSAGRLVEAAGLKGRRVGGAAVSTKHANFIEVAPGTRAIDVLHLIQEVREVVAATDGHVLAPEVRVVGDFA